MSKVSCKICGVENSIGHLTKHYNLLHRNADLDIINAGLERKSRFQRCDRCNMFCRGLRGMGKHRPKCGRVVDKDSLVGTGDDLSSIVSDFSTASGGEGINILATAARAAAVDVTEEEGKDGELVLETGNVPGSAFSLPTGSQVENFVEDMEVSTRTARNPGENIDAAVEGMGGGLGVNLPRPRRTVQLVTLDALTELLAQFQQGLYYTHYSWREPMRDISVKCWDLACGSNEQQAMVNYAGFLILPGLLSVMRKIRGGQKPIDFLVKTAAEDYPGRVIIRRARVVLDERERMRGSRVFRPPSVDSLVRQVDECIDEDRLSAAATIVARIQETMDGVVPQPPLSLEEFRAKISSLHPDSDEMDILPPNAAEDPEGIQVTGEMVSRECSKLNKKSVNGPSGWTNRTITAMMTTSRGGEAGRDKLRLAAESLARLMNKSLDGSLHAKVAALMVLARAGLIPKTDGSGGWRPLGIGEGFYRLQWKVVIRATKDAVGAQLLPHQLAVGVKGGCEIGARLAQMVYDVGGDDVEGGEQMCLIQMDLENAFNLQARRKIYDALKRYAPGLVRIFRVQYGIKAKLYLGSGEYVGTSATGVRQGCPGASMLFSVGNHDPLVELHEAAQVVKAEVGSILPAGASGFADDNSLFIGERGAERLIARSMAIIGETRMRVKVSKCKTLVHSGRRDKVLPEADPLTGERRDPAFEVVETGIIVLGNPVGTEQYRREQLETAVTAMAAPLTALTRVNPQAAFIMLQLCYNARPCYLSRVSEPHLYWDCMRAFDAAVDVAVAGIAKTPLTPEMKDLRSLPQRLGGLGLPRHCGAQSEKGCLASRALTRAYIETHRPELAPGMDSWQEVVVGEGDGSRYRAELSIEDGEIEELDSSLPADVLTVIAEHKRVWMGVYQHLLRQHRRHHAAWLLSGTSLGTGGWLSWRGGADGRFRIGGEEYVECLRLRLLVDPFPAPGLMACPHCTDVRFADAPLHPLECERLSPARLWRHNRVRDFLFAALMQCYSTADLRSEHMMTGTEGRRLKGDIVMRNGPELTVFDVAVVDPAAPSYLAKGSDKKEDVAAGQREMDKRAGWQAIGGVEGAHFIPFVVEATGRLGPSALKFFNEKLISADGSHIAKLFLLKLNFTIARWNARMVLQARGKISVGFNPPARMDEDGGAV